MWAGWLWCPVKSHNQVQPSGSLAINTPDSNRLTGQSTALDPELLLWKLVMSPHCTSLLSLSLGGSQG